MTHRKPVAYRSPVFRIRAPLPLCFPVLTVAPPDLRPATAPPDLRPPPLPRQISGCRRCPARSPAAAAAPPDLRPATAPPDLRPATAPPDLRPPRDLPARSPPAPRASLGASARSPARPRRPRIGLRSGGSWRAFPLPSQALASHATQNSPSTRTTPVSQPYFTSGRIDGLECTAKYMGITCMLCARA